MERFIILGLLVEKNTKQTKNGKPFLELNVMNGKINRKIFVFNEAQIQDIKNKGIEEEMMVYVECLAKPDVININNELKPILSLSLMNIVRVGYNSSYTKTNDNEMIRDWIGEKEQEQATTSTTNEKDWELDF